MKYKKLLIILFIWAISITNVTKVEARIVVEDASINDANYSVPYYSDATVGLATYNSSPTENINLPNTVSKGEVNSNSTVNSNTQNSNSNSDNSSGLLSEIKELINNIGKNITEYFAKNVQDFFANTLVGQTMLMTNTLNFFQEILTDTSFLNIPIVGNIQSAVKPIAISLIGLFFVMDFTKKTIYFEMMEPLSIIKPIVKMMFAKYAVDSSGRFLEMILDVVNKITISICSSANLASMIDFNSIYNSSTFTNILHIMLFSVLNWLGNIVIIILIGVALVMVNIMKVELIFIISLSPLFFATLGSDLTNDVFKSYIKNFIGVALQRSYIMLAVAMLANGYIGYYTNQGMFSTFSQLAVGVLTLTIFTIRAPSSVRNLIGSGGGTGINLTSIIMLLK